MDAWSEPLYDAETMRAVDAWAIEAQGVPSLELMEAAGPGGRRGGGRGGDGRTGPDRLRQGQQRWRRPGRRAPPGGRGHRGRRAPALAGRTSCPATRARTSTALDGGARHVEAGDLDGRPRGLGRRRRRDLRHRVRRRAPRAGRRRDRGDQRLRRPGGRRRHRLRASTPPPARSRGPRSTPTLTVTLPRRQARPLDRPGQAPPRRAAGGGDRDPAGRRPSPPAG